MLRQRFPCCNHDGHDKRSGVVTGLALDRDFISRQSVFMSRSILFKAKGFYVTTENFWVATEFSRVLLQQSAFMSGQSLVKAKGHYVVTENFLCRDRISWADVATKDFVSR